MVEVYDAATGKTEKKNANLIRTFGILAVLGAINLIVYFVTQVNYIMQNLPWVYGLVTLVDVIVFSCCWAIVDAYSQDAKDKSKPLSRRFKTTMWIAGLWLLSIPIAIASYVFSSYGLGVILSYVWGASLVASGMYDASYLFVIIGMWVTKGIEWKTPE